MTLWPSMALEGNLVIPQWVIRQLERDISTRNSGHHRSNWLIPLYSKYVFPSHCQPPPPPNSHFLSQRWALIFIPSPFFCIRGWLTTKTSKPVHVYVFDSGLERVEQLEVFARHLIAAVYVALSTKPRNQALFERSKDEMPAVVSSTIYPVRVKGLSVPVSVKD